MLYTATSVAALLLSLDVFVGAMSSAIGRSLKTPDSILVPRDKPFVGMCGSSQWMGRICNGTEGTASWVDICSKGNKGDNFSVKGGCGSDLLCVDTVDTDGKSNIGCLANPENSAHAVDGQQSGVLYIDRKGSGPAKEYIVSVQLTKALANATIAASVQGKGLTTVPQPTAALVASIRNTNLKGCDFAWDYRYCVPNKKFDLKADQWIDFTVGLGGNAEYYVFYAILGSSTK